MRKRIPRNHLNNNGDARPRLSVHLDEPDKAWWMAELARVAIVDGLGGRPAMSVLLHRIARANLRLDEESIARIERFLEEEPVELTHKQPKRARVSA